ncbi:MAG: hypothetical protein ACLU9S_06195 [Oscillospiraceae bacterium]
MPVGVGAAGVRVCGGGLAAEARTGAIPGHGIGLRRFSTGMSRFCVRFWAATESRLFCRVQESILLKPVPDAVLTASGGGVGGLDREPVFRYLKSALCHPGPGAPVTGWKTM